MIFYFRWRSRIISFGRGANKNRSNPAKLIEVYCEKCGYSGSALSNQRLPGKPGMSLTIAEMAVLTNGRSPCPRCSGKGRKKVYLKKRERDIIS